VAFYILEQLKIDMHWIKLEIVTLSNRITSKESKLYFTSGGSREVQK